MVAEDVVRTFHLVDLIFYGPGARKDRDEVSYVKPAERGEARLYGNENDRYVFNYFASLALLAPTEEGNSLKERIKLTWNAKQAELLNHLSKNVDSKEQVKWWVRDTEELFEKIGTGAPDVTLADPEEFSLSEQPEPGLGRERQARRVQIGIHLAETLTKFGEVQFKLDDLVEAGVSDGDTGLVGANEAIETAIERSDATKDVGEKNQIVSAALQALGQLLAEIQDNNEDVNGIDDIMAGIYDLL